MKSSWEAFIFLPFGQGCAAACSAAFVLNLAGPLEGGQGKALTRGPCLPPARYKRAASPSDNFPGAERTKVTCSQCKCLARTCSPSVTESTQAQHEFVPLSSAELGDPPASYRPTPARSCSCRSAPSGAEQRMCSPTMQLARGFNVCLGRKNPRGTVPEAQISVLGK